MAFTPCIVDVPLCRTHITTYFFTFNSSKRKHSSPAENSLCEESTGHAADKDSKQPCDTKSPRRSPRLACYKTPDAQPEQTTSKIVPRSLEADFNK